MSTMTTHERFTRMYQHREADRVPFLDYAWNETVERWRSEGLPTDDYLGYFDLDKTAYIKADSSPGYPETVVEETDEYKIVTTKWGATIRNWKKMTSTPEFLDFKVTNPEVWAECRARMVAADDRIPWKWLQNNYKTWRTEGRWITGGLFFGFDNTHASIIGMENMLIALLEDPQWCSDMFNHELNVDLALLEKIWNAGYTFDELHWYDDMGYKNAQFFSMDVYRELLKPVHQRAIDWGHAHGVKVRLHSCGNVMPFVPDFVEMGLDALNPLEVKAGMKPMELKQKYGDQLVFHGGVNAVLWDQPEAITAEMEQLIPVMKKNGGYIFASDHSIPPHVSFEDFSRIIANFKRIGSYE